MIAISRMILFVLTDESRVHPDCDTNDRIRLVAEW